VTAAKRDVVSCTVTVTLTAGPVKLEFKDATNSVDEFLVLNIPAATTLTATTLDGAAVADLSKVPLVVGTTHPLTLTYAAAGKAVTGLDPKNVTATLGGVALPAPTVSAGVITVQITTPAAPGAAQLKVQVQDTTADAGATFTANLNVLAATAITVVHGQALTPLTAGPVVFQVTQAGGNTCAGTLAATVPAGVTLSPSSVTLGANGQGTFQVIVPDGASYSSTLTYNDTASPPSCSAVTVPGSKIQ
jgi:hypothetical protein